MSQHLGMNSATKFTQMHDVLQIQVTVYSVSWTRISYHSCCLLAVSTISNASNYFLFFHRLPLVKLIQPAGCVPIKKLIYIGLAKKFIWGQKVHLSFFTKPKQIFWPTQK